MADSLQREFDRSDIDRKLNNQQLRNGCDVVCDRLKIRDVCQTSSQRDCLVQYPYGLTLGETYDVALQSGFAERLEKALESETRGGALQEATEAEEGPAPLPPFKPDWRFWGGVTLAGVGLFLHRNR